MDNSFQISQLYTNMDTIDNSVCDLFVFVCGIIKFKCVGMTYFLCEDIKMDDKNLVEKQVSSKVIYDGFVLHVREDVIELPNGEPASRELIKHIGAVCVIPVTKEGNVIMERQYRYPVSRVITEIPAGKLDSAHEDRFEAVKRELREETGLSADNWRDLGEYLPAPAYSDERISMYLATGLHKGEQDLDEDEFLEVFEVPLKDLYEDVMSGKICDGKTQIAILKAYEILKDTI